MDRLPEILRKVESSLADNILPFWTRNTWDEDSGGFITHLDRTGNRLGPTDKYLVMQARMIWALAAAHRHGLAHRGYLELAGKGVRFLTDRMWDVEHSGFFWRVGRDGQPVDARKITYGHAFAIYALAEFAMASGDPGALGWAETVFDVLYEKADDGELGVREEFARDWTVSPANGRERKTVGTHLHLLEGLTTLAKASGPGRAGTPRHFGRLWRSCSPRVSTSGIAAHWIIPSTARGDCDRPSNARSSPPTVTTSNSRG